MNYKNPSKNHWCNQIKMIDATKTISWSINISLWKKFSIIDENSFNKHYINGLVQERLTPLLTHCLRLSCTNPSMICKLVRTKIDYNNVKTITLGIMMPEFVLIKHLWILMMHVLIKYCINYELFMPGARFTNDVLPAIQIRWKLCLAVIPLLAKRSQQISAHAMTAQLPCHVQKFVVITVL